MKQDLKGRILMLLFALHLMLFLSCSSDNPSSSGEVAPEIPPLGSMTMDLSLFTSAGNSTETIAGQNNFVAAAVTVTLVNAFVIIALSVPVAATAAALNEDPVREDDGKFHWRFSDDINNSTLALELTAEVQSSGVHWEMFVTGQFGATQLDNFLWYEGDGNGQGTAGSWQFYDPNQPNDSIEFWQIDWQYNSETDRTLVFENNRENDPGFGSTITYTVDGEDVTLVFINTDTGKTIEVSWNRTTGAGYIMSPDRNNGEKTCWDENQQDVVCLN